MYVQTRTETRTVTPFYIENPTRDLITITVPGMNRGTTTQAERVKIVALADGWVSVKGLGKSGFMARHYPGNARIMVEGERSISLADFLFLFGNRENGLSLAVQIP